MSTIKRWTGTEWEHLTATAAVGTTAGTVAAGDDARIVGAAPNVLTGYVSAAGTVATTDTVLGAIQKLDGNVAGKMPLAGTAGAVSFGAVTATSLSAGADTITDAAGVFTASAARPYVLSLANRDVSQRWGIAVDTDVVGDGNFGIIDRTKGLLRLTVTPSGSIHINTPSVLGDGTAKLQVNGGGYFSGNVSITGKASVTLPTVDTTAQGMLRAVDSVLSTGANKDMGGQISFEGEYHPSIPGAVRFGTISARKMYVNSCHAESYMSFCTSDVTANNLSERARLGIGGLSVNGGITASGVVISNANFDASLANTYDFLIQALSDTAVRIKMRGVDGVTRYSAGITLY